MPPVPYLPSISGTLGDTGAYRHTKEAIFVYSFQRFCNNDPIFKPTTACHTRVKMAQHVTQKTNLPQHVVVRRVEGEHVAACPVSTLVVMVVDEDERVAGVQHARGSDLLQVAEVLNAVSDGPAIFELRDVAKVGVFRSLEGGGEGRG